MRWAATIPDCDAGVEDTFNHASVEVAEHLGSHAKFAQSPQKVQSLLGLFDDLSGVVRPGEILAD